MRVTRTIGPAPAVTVDEVKANLLILHNEQNARIERLILAASELVEDQCDRVFGASTFEIEIDAFPSYTLKAPVPDLTGVVSVAYTGTDGVAATLAPGDVQRWVSGDLTPMAATWPEATGPILLTVTAGRGWPASAKEAVHLIVAHWFANPEGAARAIDEIPLGASSIISTLRRPSA